MAFDTLKQVGNQFGGFLNRSTIGNLQKGALGISRGINGAMGNISGTFKFSNLAANVKDFGVREILDNQIMKEQLKLMSTFARRMDSFNANTFSGIYKTYSSNPRKLKDVVNDIVSIYIHDTDAFIEAYKMFIGTLIDSINKLDGLDEEVMASVLSFLRQAEKLAEQGKFNLPSGSVDTIKNKIREVTIKQKNRLDKYSSDDAEELANMQKNTVGKYIKTMTGISWVAFKGKRLIDKITNTQFKIILKDMAEMQRQIDAGKLEANFFPMVIEYLGSIDKCEDLARDFRSDMKLLFSTVEKDYVMVRDSMARFITILGNEEGTVVLKAQITKIEAIAQRINMELTGEIKDTEKLKQDLAMLQLEAPKLLDNIKELSQGMLNRLKDASVANQVLKDFAARK